MTELWTGEPKWPQNMVVGDELANREKIAILVSRGKWLVLTEIFGEVIPNALFMSAHVALWGSAFTEHSSPWVVVVGGFLRRNHAKTHQSAISET